MKRRTEYPLGNKGFLQTYNDPDSCTVAIFKGDRLSTTLEPFFQQYQQEFKGVGFFYNKVPYSLVQEYLKTVGN